jgi:hypothetical protein
MAVIDADEETIRVVVSGEHLAKLGRIYLVPRLGGRMDIPSAYDAIRHFTVAEEKTAAFFGRGLAGMGHDLVA